MSDVDPRPDWRVDKNGAYIAGPWSDALSGGLAGQITRPAVWPLNG